MSGAGRADHLHARIASAPSADPFNGPLTPGPKQEVRGEGSLVPATHVFEGSQGIAGARDEVLHIRLEQGAVRIVVGGQPDGLQVNEALGNITDLVGEVPYGWMRTHPPGHAVVEGSDESCLSADFRRSDGFRGRPPELGAHLPRPSKVPPPSTPNW